MAARSQRYEETITHVMQILAGVNLRVLHTFDLDSACARHPGGICPHHGTAPCDCQMTVLMAFSPSHEPVFLTGHACDGRIRFSLESPPSPLGELTLETIIKQVVRAEHYFIEAEA
jgi:hypothetical protein